MSYENKLIIVKISARDDSVKGSQTIIEKTSALINNNISQSWICCLLDIVIFSITEYESIAKLIKNNPKACHICHPTTPISPKLIVDQKNIPPKNKTNLVFESIISDFEFHKSRIE